MSEQRTVSLCPPVFTIACECGHCTNDGSLIPLIQRVHIPRSEFRSPGCYAMNNVEIEKALRALGVVVRSENQQN